MFSFRLSAIAAAAVMSASLLASGGAQAVTCPASPASNDQIFTINSGASSCLGTGDGHVNQPADTPAILSAYTWLDKSGSANGFDVVDGALTIGAGTWSIN